MQRNFQLGHIAERKPIWLRLIAMLCVLLISIASTAEVCHSHPDLSSASKNSQRNAPAPDHCPLCVAMHTALPATAQTSPDPVLQVQMIVPRTVALQRALRWSYELFSRPPPAMSLTA
jgi:hypothetical protein